ncbi:hypothetical protein DRQ29_03465 [bacterium]|nr:MAG: hypothetical protein DRQ29_03465 [bacterium]
MTLGCQTPISSGFRKKLHKKNRQAVAIRLFLSFQLFLNWLKYYLINQVQQGIQTLSEGKLHKENTRRVLHKENTIMVFHKENTRRVQTKPVFI